MCVTVTLKDSQSSYVISTLVQDIQNAQSLVTRKLRDMCKDSCTAASSEDPRLIHVQTASKQKCGSVQEHEKRVRGRDNT